MDMMYLMRQRMYMVLPTWARQTLKDSNIEGIPLIWENEDSPRLSHWIREKGFGECLHTNYGLMWLARNGGPFFRWILNQLSSMVISRRRCMLSSLPAFSSAVQGPDFQVNTKGFV